MSIIKENIPCWYELSYEDEERFIFKNFRGISQKKTIYFE